MPAVEHVLAAQNELGEGPLWDPREGILYWVDIFKNRVHSLQPDTGAAATYQHDTQVCALGLRKSGGLVAAISDGFAYWDAGRLTRFLTIDLGHPEMRFNDGAVGPAGNFWAGTMSTAGLATGKLYRLSASGAAEEVEHAVTISNGIGWSPDRRTMYYTDSPLKVIYAYDFDLDSGAIRDRRIFNASPDEPGVPDGLTIDEQGYVWSARWDGWKLTRYAPDGSVDREVGVPVGRPTSVMFGGQDLDTLYITSARPDPDPAALEAQPLAGDLFRFKPGVRGLPEPYFKG